ncbi:MAG: PrsW family intramembrane metalloprotease [Muribaculaceae bacterium]
MSRYEIMKEDAILGPFDINEIEEFVKSGLILKRDYAYDVQYPDSFRTVEFFMKRHGKTVSVEHKGNVFSQIQELGQELILPSKTFSKEPWRTDRKLFVLALVGLGLSLILSIAPFMNLFGIFYVVALYFSIIWGLFFYYLFKTEQVNLKTTAAIFFGTQGVILIAYNILGIGAYNPFEGLYENDNNIIALISCILGIGCVEEIVKLIPVILVLYFSKNVLKPQTVVFYGLMSGIAFGVFEGVEYQMGPNFQMLLENDVADAYVYSYLSNIARLTSLPFLHAVWCGIGSYFLAFAYLYPRYRKSLYLLAILIPATIHGLYDYLCFNVPISLVTIPVVIVGVVLLMVYLSIGRNFHLKLND